MSLFLPSFFRQLESLPFQPSATCDSSHDEETIMHISFSGSIFAIVLVFLVLETVLFVVGTICRWCFQPNNLGENGWIFEDEYAMAGSLLSRAQVLRIESDDDDDSSQDDIVRRHGNFPQPYAAQNCDDSRTRTICCAICLEHDAKDLVKFSNCCQSIFHKHCLQRWLRVRLACPCCRKAAAPCETQDVHKDSALSTILRWPNPRDLFDENGEQFYFFTF
mmetsp:Transcript_6539/g.17767  ORF Transcript_6539/g.17767 Transcript_6539/m.17767 type:complete len:220 (-) Transcript_6539:945-1604(-)